MAAYTVAAAEVLPRPNTQLKQVIGGEVFSAGAALYKKASDGRYYLAQGDGTAEECKFEGIAMSACAVAGQPILMAYDGEVQLDTGDLANAAVGDLVVLGATAGSLYPSDDLVSTNRVTLCGYIKTETPAVLVLHPLQTAVVKA
jgi:hypothetical protein